MKKYALEGDLVEQIKYEMSDELVSSDIVGSSAPYDYLVASIEKFYDQKQLANLMIKNNFAKVEFRNLSNGISAIHSGWKI